MKPTGTRGAMERWAWAAGIVFVAALVAETAVSFGFPIDQNDSAAKIATTLEDHRRRLLLVMALCVVYAGAFPIWLSKLYTVLRGHCDRAFAALVLVGGLLMIALHAVSDVGIYGLLVGKLAAYGARHDHGLSYTLYLLTFALDSVGDLFGSLFLLAAGILVLRYGVLPRWLGWVAVVAAPFLFAQTFGLGGVVSGFGLLLDGIGFVLFLLFVLASSLVMVSRGSALVPAPGP